MKGGFWTCTALRSRREQDRAASERLQDVLERCVRRGSELEVVDAVQLSAELPREHLAPPAVRRPGHRDPATLAASSCSCSRPTAAAAKRSGHSACREAPGVHFGVEQFDDGAPAVRRRARRGASASRAGGQRSGEPARVCRASEQAIVRRGDELANRREITRDHCNVARHRLERGRSGCRRRRRRSPRRKGGRRRSRCSYSWMTRLVGERSAQLDGVLQLSRSPQRSANASRVWPVTDDPAREFVVPRSAAARQASIRWARPLRPRSWPTASTTA